MLSKNTFVEHAQQKFYLTLKKPKFSRRTAHKLCRTFENTARVALSDIGRMLKAQGTSVITHTIQRSLDISELHGRLPLRTPLHKMCPLDTLLIFVKYY